LLCTPPLFAQSPPAPAPTLVKQEDSTIPQPKPDDSEVRLGRENADEHDKQTKFITDPVQLDRVRRIGQELAAIANSTPMEATWGYKQMKQFQYVFKIVDDKVVNAYAMPGGFIYVNKGLLDIIRSDDELAGVLAHEVSHAAHHHIVKLIKEQQRIQKLTLPLQLVALIAALAARGAGATDAANIYLATNLYETAKVNSYGVEAEKDADQMGIRLLMKSRYNPTGLYSFMVRLAALERRSGGGLDYGIYRTHPPGEERVAAAKKQLQELGVPIQLSVVDPTVRATLAPVVEMNKTLPQIDVNVMGIRVCRIIGTEDAPPDERAEKVAKRLDMLFDSNLSPLEINLSRDRTRILARGQSLLTLADAEGQKMTMEELIRSFKEAVVEVTQRRQIEFAK
jgi:predicted Zn-dependent protease